MFDDTFPEEWVDEFEDEDDFPLDDEDSWDGVGVRNPDDPWSGEGGAEVEIPVEEKVYAYARFV